jgi:hypothetical protein
VIQVQQTDTAANCATGSYCSPDPVAQTPAANRKAIVGGAAGSTAQSITLAAGTTRVIIAQYEIPTAGYRLDKEDWTVRINVSQAATQAGTILSGCFICQVNSLCASVATIASLTGQFIDLTTTGVKTMGLKSLGVGPLAVGDMIQVIICATNGSPTLSDSFQLTPNQLINTALELGWWGNEEAGPLRGIPVRTRLSKAPRTDEITDTSGSLGPFLPPGWKGLEDVSPLRARVWKTPQPVATGAGAGYMPAVGWPYATDTATVRLKTHMPPVPQETPTEHFLFITTPLVPGSQDQGPPVRLRFCVPLTGVREDDAQIQPSILFVPLGWRPPDDINVLPKVNPRRWPTEEAHLFPYAIAAFTGPFQGSLVPPDVDVQRRRIINYVPPIGTGGMLTVLPPFGWRQPEEADIARRRLFRVEKIDREEAWQPLPSFSALLWLPLDQIVPPVRKKAVPASLVFSGGGSRFLPFVGWQQPDVSFPLRAQLYKALKEEREQQPFAIFQIPGWRQPEETYPVRGRVWKMDPIIVPQTGFVPVIPAGPSWRLPDEPFPLRRLFRTPRGVHEEEQLQPPILFRSFGWVRPDDAFPLRNKVFRVQKGDQEEPERQPLLILPVYGWRQEELFPLRRKQVMPQIGQQEEPQEFAPPAPVAFGIWPQPLDLFTMRRTVGRVPERPFHEQPEAYRFVPTLWVPAVDVAALRRVLTLRPDLTSQAASPFPFVWVAVADLAPVRHPAMTTETTLQAPVVAPLIWVPQQELLVARRPGLFVPQKPQHEDAEVRSLTVVPPDGWRTMDLVRLQSKITRILERMIGVGAAIQPIPPIGWQTPDLYPSLSAPLGIGQNMKRLTVRQAREIAELLGATYLDFGPNIILIVNETVTTH